MAGPFPYRPIANLIVSPVGLVPKADGSWRLITHLSYPEGLSINDGIDHALCSVKYTSFDKVTQMLYGLGPSALIAKRDLKSAYRLLPICVDDLSLLGMKVGGLYYVDKCLPFGLSQSASLFEKFPTFLHWLVAKQTGIDSLDFIFAGAADSNSCHTLVTAFEGICSELGIPIAVEKSTNPTTIMVFLDWK